MAKEGHRGERRKPLIPYKMDLQYPGSICSEGGRKAFLEEGRGTGPIHDKATLPIGLAPVKPV